MCTAAKCAGGSSFPLCRVRRYARQAARRTREDPVGGKLRYTLLLDVKTEVRANPDFQRGENCVMAYTVRRIDYFYAMVSETPETGYRVLSELSQQGVNLVAVTAVPFGPTRTQLTIFPNDTAMLQHAAQAASIPLDGPHPALVVQGDDEVGALAHIHEKLRDADVAVFASTGVADGRGGFGYIIYVRPEEYERAARALGL